MYRWDFLKPLSFSWLQFRCFLFGSTWNSKLFLTAVIIFKACCPPLGKEPLHLALALQALQGLKMVVHASHWHVLPLQDIIAWKRQDFNANDLSSSSSNQVGIYAFKGIQSPKILNLSVTCKLHSVLYQDLLPSCFELFWIHFILPAGQYRVVMFVFPKHVLTLILSFNT